MSGFFHMCRRRAAAAVLLLFLLAATLLASRCCWVVDGARIMADEPAPAATKRRSGYVVRPAPAMRLYGGGYLPRPKVIPPSGPSEGHNSIGTNELHKDRAPRKP